MAHHRALHSHNRQGSTDDELLKGRTNRLGFHRPEVEKRSDRGCGRNTLPVDRAKVGAIRRTMQHRTVEFHTNRLPHDEIDGIVTDNIEFPEVGGTPV
jgi:hypothetical protein